MALILEVVDTRTGDVQSRIRLRESPLTIGRDYANDLILDDPYVDGHHARIVPDGTGTFVLEDLGSVNQLVQGAGTRVFRVTLSGGTEVRIGRTTLRFRDTEAAIPPALPDRAEPGGASGALDWITSREGRVAIPLLATGMATLQVWLGTHERSSAGAVFGLVVALAVATVLYVSIWAVATRIIRHRFSFFQHLSLASASYVAGSIIGVLFGWAEFAFPDGHVLGPMQMLALLAMTAASVALHLAFASNLPARRRWESGLAISVVLFGITGLSALAIEEGFFSQSPPYSSEIKPVPVSLIPTVTVSDFARAASKLQEKVDTLAAEP